jgi:hypothetical protein
VKILQARPIGFRPPQKTGEFPAVNVKAETEALPAKKSAEDLVETCKIQVIRYGQNPDHHGAYFA